MTHDELQDKLEDWAITMSNYRYISDALRAVVELHKPIEEDGKLWCKHEACYSHIEFLERTDCECDYPCPTIQKIIENLE